MYKQISKGYITLFDHKKRDVHEQFNIATHNMRNNIQRFITNIFDNNFCNKLQGIIIKYTACIINYNIFSMHMYAYIHV